MKCAPTPPPPPSMSSHSEQRGTEGRGCWPGIGELLLLLLGPLVVRGVGAAVYVAIGLEAVLGCSHHVRRFHRGSENRWRDTETERL